MIDHDLLNNARRALRALNEGLWLHDGDTPEESTKRGRIAEAAEIAEGAIFNVQNCLAVYLEDEAAKNGIKRFQEVRG